MGAGNVYFDLTEELNAEGTIAVLASGQAVVFYRISMMSKDGDWILRETPEACQVELARSWIALSSRIVRDWINTEPPASPIYGNFSSPGSAISICRKPMNASAIWLNACCLANL